MASGSSAPADLYYVIWNNPATGDLTPGDTVQEYITVTPLVGDADPANNTEIVIDTVRASCDPNELSVSPIGCIPSGTSPATLQYTIHFQNTGTDTAFNIYVMDSLSDNVDPKSLRIVLASATMNIDIQKGSGHNVVKFDFPNINLLDSSRCSQCSGSVIFNINTRPGLLDGDSIFNHAGIFFDYNPIVITNTVENTIGCASALGVVTIIPNKVQIFPNPTSEELTIKMDPHAYNSFTITNNVGQVLMQQQLNTTQTIVSVKSIPAGMYYITLKGDNGNTVQKFVKM